LSGANGPAPNGPAPNIFCSQWSHRLARMPAHDDKSRPFTTPRSGFVQPRRWSEPPPRFAVTTVSVIRRSLASASVTVGRRSLSLVVRRA
jgi:hypothetical protein